MAHKGNSMEKSAANLIIMAVIIGFFVVPSGVFFVVVSQELPTAHPELINHDQMRFGVALTHVTGLGIFKIYPQDMQQLLFSTDSTVYCEVYVSDVENTTWNNEQIYVPSQAVANELSKIPNTHFYVSRFSPSIGMVVERQELQEIAANHSVYCIRIIPKLSTYT